MKKTLILCCMLASTSAMAQVYKCTGANGAMQYTQQPCQNGKQQAIDLDARNAEKQKETELEQKRLEAERKRKEETDALERKRLEPILKVQEAKRAAEIEKETKIARERFLLIDRAKVKGVVECQRAGCTPGEYRELLIGRPPGMIEEVLNCRTQEIGSSTMRHCSVLLIDAGRARNGRLQIMSGYVSDLPEGVISTNRINEVNVY